MARDVDLKLYVSVNLRAGSLRYISGHEFLAAYSRGWSDGCKTLSAHDALQEGTPSLRKPVSSGAQVRQALIGAPVRPSHRTVREIRQGCCDVLRIPCWCKLGTRSRNGQS